MVSVLTVSEEIEGHQNDAEECDDEHTETNGFGLNREQNAQRMNDGETENELMVQ